MLLEIERESALKAARRKAKEGRPAKDIKRAQMKKRRREKSLEMNERRSGWRGNFGYGARLPEYRAEEDRYCPLAQARRFNRTISAVDLATGTQKSPMRGVTMFRPPAILANATLALAGPSTEPTSPLMSKTEPLPPIKPAAPASPEPVEEGEEKKAKEDVPDPPPIATVSYQSSYESEAALEIVKLILAREKLVLGLKGVIEGSEVRFLFESGLLCCHLFRLFLRYAINETSHATRFVLRRPSLPFLRRPGTRRKQNSPRIHSTRHWGTSGRRR